MSKEEDVLKTQNISQGEDMNVENRTEDGNKPAENSKEEETPAFEDMNMADLLGEEVKMEEGKIVQTKVISKTLDGVLVDLGLKSEGLIPKDDFESEERFEEIKEGEEIPVQVIRLQSSQGHPIVSYRRVFEKKLWEKLEDVFKNEKPVEGKIKEKIKGGFRVNIGINAFLPLSQVDIRMVQDTDIYLNKQFEFLITELNRSSRNVVLSRKKLLDAARKDKRKQLLSILSVGQVMDGVVSGITKFGAFIDIGGLDGLLHIGDITWHHLKKVEDVLKIGQKVKVQVTKIDLDGEKVSLGMKQLSPHPWENAEEKYPIGMVVKGKITSITDFGVFAEIAENVEGLLHISELSWTERGEDVKKRLKKGDELDLKIIALDREKEKISLSLKQLKPNPWEEVRMKYPPSSKVKGTVTHLTPFGAFIRLPEGIEGLIHVADMSWVKKVHHPQDILNVNQEVEVMVLEVNPNTEKIALSIKHMSQNPFDKYRQGRTVKGVVKRILDFGAFVELEPGIEALLRAGEVSQDKNVRISDLVTVNQEIEAKIIKSDLKDKKIDISVRRLEREREKELIKKYTNNNANPTLGEVLEEQ